MSWQRSFAIDSYIRDTERTVVMVRRPDGRVGAHDLRTGELLGILDARDQRDQEDEPMPGAGALLWGTVCLFSAVVLYVIFHVGMAVGRGSP